MLSRICCTAAFLVGLLAYHLPWSTALQLLAALLVALLLLPAKARRQIRWTWLALGLTIGVARATADQACWTPFPQLPGQHRWSGSVLESPRQWGSSLVFFFSVEQLDGVPQQHPLVLLVRWSGANESVAPGERWEWRGRLKAGQPASYPGGFSQAFWLWTQRAHGVLEVGQSSEISYLGPPRGWGPRALAARLRQRMLVQLERLPHAGARALVAGVVFGDTQALPRDVQEQFRRTGTSHLLAASGMNVALLLGLLTAAARLFGYGPWRVAPALVPVAIGYAFLAGCAPSISRAAAAAVVGLLAAWWGRKSSSWNSLCLSVWILLLWEPRQLYDPGFQLSVAAVVGLIAGPSLDDSAASWQKSTVMTVSATLLTLPVMWTMFHELSLTLLPANLILGPLVELLFPLGLLFCLLPLPPLRWLTEAVARLSLWLVGLLSQWADPVPLAQPGASCLLLLVLAIALWVGCWSRTRWLALPLAVGSVLLGQSLAARPELAGGELRVRQLSVEGKEYYWLSSREQELLVLSDEWQEKRARAMLLDLGCRRPPQVRLLQPGQSLQVRWGAFRWGNVHPLLPKAPFVEVITTGSTYRVNCWRPAP
jgi:competence protein ComEC